MAIDLAGTPKGSPSEPKVGQRKPNLKGTTQSSYIFSTKNT